MKGGKNISSSLASHSTGETRHSDIMNKHKNVLDTLGAGKNRNLHFSFRIFLKWAISVVCLIFTGLPKQSERKESFCHEMRLSHPWERIPRKMAASAGKTTPLGFPHTAGACVWFCPVQHVKAGQ